jgi:hypothetical protein
VNASEKRILLPLLKRIHHGETPSFRMRSAAQFLLHRLGKPSKKRKKPSAECRAAQAAGRRADAAALRQAVSQRADGRCEGARLTLLGWRRCGGAPDELDHWLGGSGRRKQKQSLESAWMLCRLCHRRRTENIPDAQSWNEVFALHCERYGYPVIAHIIHQQLSTQGSEASIPPNAETPVLGRKEEDSNA